MSVLYLAFWSNAQPTELSCPKCSWVCAMHAGMSQLLLAWKSLTLPWPRAEPTVAGFSALQTQWMQRADDSYSPSLGLACDNWLWLLLDRGCSLVSVCMILIHSVYFDQYFGICILRVYPLYLSCSLWELLQASQVFDVFDMSSTSELHCLLSFIPFVLVW